MFVCLTMTNPNQMLLFGCSKMVDETNLSSKLPVADGPREIWGGKLCWWCLSSGFLLRMFLFSFADSFCFVFTSTPSYETSPLCSILCSLGNTYNNKPLNLITQLRKCHNEDKIGLFVWSWTSAAKPWTDWTCTCWYEALLVRCFLGRQSIFHLHTYVFLLQYETWPDCTDAHATCLYGTLLIAGVFLDASSYFA